MWLRACLHTRNWTVRARKTSFGDEHWASREAQQLKDLCEIIGNISGDLLLLHRNTEV